MPGWGLRVSQNFSTNSCCSSPKASEDQVLFSSGVMSHWIGPSAQAAPTGSCELGGSLNSWKATNIAGRFSSYEESGAAAELLRAAWNAATAFFE